jgi:hypothetical protein
VTFANADAILARGTQDVPTRGSALSPDPDPWSAVDVAVMDVSGITDIDIDGAETLGRIARHLQSRLRCTDGAASSLDSVLVVNMRRACDRDRLVVGELPPTLLSDSWFVVALETKRVFASLDDALAAAPRLGRYY